MALLRHILTVNLASNITPTRFFIILCSTIAYGLIISFLYILTHRRSFRNTEDLPITMVTVAVAAATVILLVGRNVSAGLGIAGIFVLTRFRSGNVQTKDLAYLFTSISMGVLSGCGYVAYAGIFTVVMFGLLFLLEAVKWGSPARKVMLLKIWVPETLNFQGVFEPILNTYTDHFELMSLKTTDFGSLCVLEYSIIPKAEFDQKGFLDAIRTCNGNMNVVLVTSPSALFLKKGA